MAGHIPDSADVDWCTPDPIIEGVHYAFGGPPALDPCSNPWSHVKAGVEYMLPEHDGLQDSWDFESIFVNPPFGKGYVHKVIREFMMPKAFRIAVEEKRVNPNDWNLYTIERWAERCEKAARDHASNVIGLVPAYVDTATWQKHIWPVATHVFFPKGRLKFRLPPVRCDANDTGGRCENEGAWYTRGIDKSKIVVCDLHKSRILLPKRWGADPAPMACALPLWSGGDPAVAKRFCDFFRPKGVVITL